MQLVDRILEAKTADPKANTSALEEEIDRLVYGLYGLDRRGNRGGGGQRKRLTAPCGYNGASNSLS